MNTVVLDCYYELHFHCELSVLSLRMQLIRAIQPVDCSQGNAGTCKVASKTLGDYDLPFEEMNYREPGNGLQILLSRTQAGPGRKVKRFPRRTSGQQILRKS